MSRKKKTMNANPRKEAERKAAKKVRKEARKKAKQLRNKIIVVAVVVAAVAAIYLYFREPKKDIFESIEQTHTIDLSNYAAPETTAGE